MFCNYINDIYKNHIHPNLIDDEFKYTKLLEETFFDLYNQISYKQHSNWGIEYCMNKGTILFRLVRITTKTDALYCTNSSFNIMMDIFNNKNCNIYHNIELIIYKYQLFNIIDGNFFYVTRLKL
jgi:hypothetical protein